MTLTLLSFEELISKGIVKWCNNPKCYYTEIVPQNGGDIRYITEFKSCEVVAYESLHIVEDDPTILQISETRYIHLDWLTKESLDNLEIYLGGN